MARILYVGCGYIGTELALHQTAVGHQCFGLRRQSNQLPDAIHALQADVTQLETLSQLPADLNYVVVSLTPERYDKASYQSVYVQGLKNLINALHRQGQTLNRIFLISSTAVYHQNNGEWVDEDSPTKPLGFSGKAMLDAEQVAARCGYPATCVRYSGIYGRGEPRLLNWAREGVSSTTQPPHYSNRIHIQDCIGVLKHLMELDMQGYELATLYLASDPNPAPFAEILDWLRTQLGEGKANPLLDIEKRLRAGSKRCSSQRL